MAAMTPRSVLRAETSSCARPTRNVARARAARPGPLAAARARASSRAESLRTLRTTSVASSRCPQPPWHPWRASICESFKMGEGEETVPRVCSPLRSNLRLSCHRSLSLSPPLLPLPLSQRRHGRLRLLRRMDLRGAAASQCAHHHCRRGPQPGEGVAWLFSRTRPRHLCSRHLLARVRLLSLRPVLPPRRAACR